MKKYLAQFLKSSRNRRQVVIRTGIVFSTSIVLYLNKDRIYSQHFSPVVLHPQNHINDFINEMKNTFDNEQFIYPFNADRGELEQYGKDLNSYHESYPPICMLYPQNTEEVAKFAKICHKYKITMIPYSKGTSLEGGALPSNSQCALICFQQMNKVVEFHEKDSQIEVQPGFGWMELNDFLEPYGLFFPVDPGPGAGIGGMVSTCCSGTNAVRYGTMRNWVLGLEVVLADGTIINTGCRAKKSSAGYNLTCKQIGLIFIIAFFKELFCGSEGTLGLITKITLQLTNLPKHKQVATVCFDSLETLSQTVEKVLASGIPIRCIELMDKNMVNILIHRLSHQKKGHEQLIPNQNLLLIALNSEDNSEIEKLRVLTKNGHNVHIATTKHDADVLWTIRKQALWTVNQYGKEVKGHGVQIWTTDVCVPISQLSKSISETQKLIDQQNLIGPIIGHVGDGNYHVVFVVDYSNKPEWRNIQDINTNMIERAIKCGGTCTGYKKEHGVGLGKRDYLRMEKGEEQIRLMRAIKQVFDPLGLLNPDKVFYSESNQDS